MKKIAVVGFKGKMGKVVYDTLKAKGFEVVGVGRGESLNNVGIVDLVIDFGSAESSVESVLWCKKNSVSIIIGSTGQNKEQNQKIENASQSIAVLKAGNFSFGIVFFKKIIEILKSVEMSSICVFEKHHEQKVDCPSGTAIELSKVVFENFGVNPQVLSERGGKEVGTHNIDFYFGDEVISVSHKAFSREAFASGVLKAVEFLIGYDDVGMIGFEEIFGK